MHRKYSGVSCAHIRKAAPPLGGYTVTGALPVSAEPGRPRASALRRHLPCRASERPILAADGCEPSLSPPGVLLLRRLGPGGPRGVTAALFGRAGSGLLIRR